MTADIVKITLTEADIADLWQHELITVTGDDDLEYEMDGSWWEQDEIAGIARGELTLGQVQPTDGRQHDVNAEFSLDFTPFEICRSGMCEQGDAMVKATHRVTITAPADVAAANAPDICCTLCARKNAAGAVGEGFGVHADLLAP
jgi:hypothetical protein